MIEKFKCDECSVELDATPQIKELWSMGVVVVCPECQSPECTNCGRVNEINDLYCRGCSLALFSSIKKVPCDGCSIELDVTSSIIDEISKGLRIFCPACTHNNLEDIYIVYCKKCYKSYDRESKYCPMHGIELTKHIEKNSPQSMTEEDILKKIL